MSSYTQIGMFFGLLHGIWSRYWVPIFRSFCRPTNLLQQGAPGFQPWQDILVAPNLYLRILCMNKRHYHHPNSQFCPYFWNFGTVRGNTSWAAGGRQQKTFIVWSWHLQPFTMFFSISEHHNWNPPSTFCPQGVRARRSAISTISAIPSFELPSRKLESLESNRTILIPARSCQRADMVSGQSNHYGIVPSLFPSRVYFIIRHQIW